MDALWPWLTVVALGALHGLNPASGWMFAAAWGVRCGDRGRALRALVPIGLGHAASVALVAAAVVPGLSMDRAVLQATACALLAAVAAVHLLGRRAMRLRSAAGHAGLALWSFLMSTAHGAGLMLVPALIPLCLGAGAARQVTASGSLPMALAAVGVHMATMLAVTGLVAAQVCRGFDAGAGWLRIFRRKLASSPAEVAPQEQSLLAPTPRKGGAPGHGNTEPLPILRAFLGYRRHRR